MVKIKVCIGSACHLKGSYNIISDLQNLIEEYDVGEKVDLSAVFCLGHCTQAVSVKMGEQIYSLNMDNVEDFFKNDVLPQVQ